MHTTMWRFHNVTLRQALQCMNARRSMSLSCCLLDPPAALLLQAQRSHQPAGSLLLPAAAQGAEWELRLQLTSNSQPGKPALAALDTIRFTLQVRKLCAWEYM